MTADWDVLVLGSGCAGMTAALRLAERGLRVAVVEKASVLGGTSAMSGGGIWVPNNHVARRAGIDDSYDEAIAYLRSASPDSWSEVEDGQWQTLVREAPRMLAYVEAHTPLKFKLVPEPDVAHDRRGGKSRGRMVTPRAVSRRRLGRYSRRLRKSTLMHLFDYEEMVSLQPYYRPLRAVLRRLPRLAWRLASSAGGQGTALMVGLISASVRAGCELLLDTRARQLDQRGDGTITGVIVECGGRYETLGARRAVIVATGGFEWNRAQLAKYFPGPTDRLGSPASNEGDGQAMLAEVGAKLDRMDQANIYPCLPARYEGRPSGIPVRYQAAGHAVIVNAGGERFVNEADFNVGEALDKRDATGRCQNLPAWIVADVRFLRRSFALRWFAAYEPAWIKRAASIKSLAEQIGVPSEALQATVERFNRSSVLGYDPDFGRGGSAWEAETARIPFSSLRPIEQPPFLAMSFNRSILGTKGGARTNSRGQVLRPDKSVIPHLYAAGLAMANPIGTRAVAPGTTLGPNMTWGFICAEDILGQAKGGEK